MSHRDDSDHQVHNISIPGHRELNFGLRWDFVGEEPFDLDVSCVSFDRAGNTGEVVYFNNLVTTGEWMVHTGDNTTGEGDDDDEAIQVYLSKIPQEIHSLVLVITCHNTGFNLGAVDSILCAVTDMTMDDLICSIPVHLSKDSTATIVCKLQRLSNSSSDVVNPFGFWELAELNKPAAGHSIADKSLVLAMQELLDISEEYLSQRKELVINIDGKKRNVAQLSADVQHLVFGIGWSKSDEDIDCTVIYMSRRAEYVDHVNSKNKLQSADKACVHCGDNVTAVDAKGTGDKEKVDLYVKQITPACDYVVFAVSTVERDGKWMGKLSQVQGSYCRIVEVKKKVGKGKTHNIEDRNVIVRGNLSKVSKDAVGVIFAVMYRDDSQAGWKVLPIQECLNHLPISSISPGEFVPIVRSLVVYLEDLKLIHAAAIMDFQRDHWMNFTAGISSTHILSVTVVEARNLGPQGKSFNCHLQLWTMDQGKQYQKFRTASSTNRIDPTWNETFEFEVTFHDSIRVVAFDRYFVGVVDIPLVKYKDIFEETLSDAWLPLCGSDVEGEIHLKMTRKVIATKKVKSRPEFCCLA